MRRLRQQEKNYKMYYDGKVGHVIFQPGDREPVRNIGLKGCHSTADRLQKQPYTVVSQPMPEIPKYRVRKENSNSPGKLLHRNMLLPFIGLPSLDDDAETTLKKTRSQNYTAIAADDFSEALVSSMSSDESSDAKVERELGVDLRPPRYTLPARSTRNRKGISRAFSIDDRRQQLELRRERRVRQPPQWLQTGDWDLGSSM